MKKYDKIISISLIAVLACMFLLSCSTGTGGGGEQTPAARIGSKKIVSAGSQTLTMIYANDSENVIFPIGVNDIEEATLTRKFWMGETEVTNAVFAEVLQWAYDKGLFSTAVGDHNGLSTATAKQGGQQLLNLGALYCRINFDGTGLFSIDAGYENRPVTGVTWYGMVQFCNWLTEMCDGTSENIVYSGIDSTWSYDETTEDSTKTGYRLPSSDEWEYAARYRGSDPVNSVSGYSNPFYTKGNAASGGIADCRDVGACCAVAVYPGQNPRPNEVCTVKSLGENSANTLGLYDMSGNAYELCFSFSDRSGRRYWVAHGGSWRHGVFELQIGYSNTGSGESDYESNSLGFRLCQTAE